MPTVLVIDEDLATRRQISAAFSGSDVRLLTAGKVEAGLALIRQQRPDVVLLDDMPPGATGLEVYGEIREIDAKLAVIFITARNSSDTAIEAMTLGAYDYLLKPLDLPKVRQLVQQVIDIRQTSMSVEPPGHEPPSRAKLLVGRSAAMQEVYKGIGRVAPQDVTVLIRGESGTGKELVAQAIHQHSQRTNRPFLAVNCAAIPDALLASELFGHEKGSFTGADQRRIGKFEQCDGGTLFLDEIGDMSPVLQGKMLRILQEHEFERVGGNETIHSDVRVIAATHRNLEKMIEEGEFRADLYYRLTGYALSIPSLRDRADDLPLLIDHLLKQFRPELNPKIQGISSEALKSLQRYHWPGNVRELQNVLTQALLSTRDSVLTLSAFASPHRPPLVGSHVAASTKGSLLGFVQQRLKADSNNLYTETLEMMEQNLIVEVLRTAAGNQSRAAKILGITRGSLRNKIRALGVSIGRMIEVEDNGVEQEAEAIAI